MPHIPDALPASPPDGRYGELLRQETERAERDATATEETK